MGRACRFHRGVTIGTFDLVVAVFGNKGLHRRYIPHLLARWFTYIRQLGRKRLMAHGARFRSVIHHAIDFFDRQQFALVPLVPGLAASFARARLALRTRRRIGRVRRGWPRRIARFLARARLPLAGLRLQLLKVSLQFCNQPFLGRNVGLNLKWQAGAYLVG